MKIRAWAVLGCMVAISACQSPSAPPPSSRPIEVPAAARAAVALGAGRYEEAATLSREALRLAPLASPSHYGLAVALSYIDRSAAIREFQWVVINAPKDSPEAGEARAWLVRAGALPKTPVEQAAASTLERQRDNAALFGRPTKEERYNLRTAEDGTFKFPNVLPGPYMLTNRVAGEPTWRLRVVLKPSEERELNLGPGNNLSAQDDFPQFRQAKPPSG